MIKFGISLVAVAVLATVALGQGQPLCTAVNADWGCCQSYRQCAHGQGDCDTDSDCIGTTVCTQNVGNNYGGSGAFDMCECLSPPCFNPATDPPTTAPTSQPSPSPSRYPSWNPTSTPTVPPSPSPSMMPSPAPTTTPTVPPSPSPSPQPTMPPSPTPTSAPTYPNFNNCKDINKWFRTTSYQHSRLAGICATFGCGVTKNGKCKKTDRCKAIKNKVDCENEPMCEAVMKVKNGRVVFKRCCSLMFGKNCSGSTGVMGG